MSGTEPNAGRLPNFLIIGAPKAGTSALSVYLSEHPDVWFARWKEVNFFNVYYERGIDWYRRQFAGATAERAVGEATPLYMYGRPVVERMASVLPDAKLIVVLRDPVDRAYSQYWWERAALSETRSFEEAVRAELRGERSSTFPRYLGGGSYRSHLEEVCRHFPRESLFVVVMEEMQERPSVVYREVCRFLGIDDAFTPASLGAEINPPYRVRWLWVRRLMFLLRAHRWPRRLARTIESWNRTEFRYPQMDEALRTELGTVFAKPNAALAEWLGRSESPWR